MYKDNYTFVTSDNSERISLLDDVMVVDVDGGQEAVMLDDVQVDGTDFITLSGDTVVISNTDIDDGYSIDVDGAEYYLWYDIDKTPTLSSRIESKRGKTSLRNDFL